MERVGMKIKKVELLYIFHLIAFQQWFDIVLIKIKSLKYEKYIKFLRNAIYTFAVLTSHAKI